MQTPPGMYPASSHRTAARISVSNRMILPLVIWATAILAAASTLRAANETLPAGTYVIAMDNSLQGSGGLFNLRAYGLAVRLLHAGVPLKWVIIPGKAKDGIDFTANASRIAPSAAGIASRDFRAGPIAVHPGYETQALAVITSFNSAAGNAVNVYQLSQDATVNVAETLVHKPKVGTISQGANPTIHTDIFDAAGMLSGVHYETITNPATLNGSSCYTLATEPHNTLTNITATVAANVKTFVQSGGNFLGQCEAVQSYSTRGLLAGFQSTQNLGGTMTFDNNDEPYAQFQGGLTDEGGAVVAFKLTSNPGKRVAYSSTDGANYKAYVGRIDGFTARSGGYVHYLGGHNYNGTGLTDINGKRMLLNAVLRSADRPFGCGITINADLAIVKTVNNATPIVGSQVTFTLLVTNNGPSPATGVTVADPLPAGYTFVSANPAAAYNSGTGSWTIGSLANGASTSLTITAMVNSSGSYLNTAIVSADQNDPNPGNNISSASTTPLPLGANNNNTCTGTVWIDTDHNGSGDVPFGGVAIEIRDAATNALVAATTTNPSGAYSFPNLPPGTYKVFETQPYGYYSVSDKDGGALDVIGDVTPIVLNSGATSSGNDFVEALNTCPDDWAAWKFLHPGETAAGNPDADAYDNFAEFAFAMPYDSGVPGKWLPEGTAWIIRPSTLAPGTLEGVFVRPKGAPLNVTYKLQYAAVPGNPTVWQTKTITSLFSTTVDNGDCTETVTIHDLAGVTGMNGGKGIVRIQADLDESGANSGNIDHTSYTEVEGWTQTSLGLNCQTFNNPWQRETIFTGTVASVSGQDLVFAGETISNLLVPGVSYYLEVTSGDLVGHRFDVVSAAGTSVSLAIDMDLYALGAPFNTLTGAPPAILAGDTVAIHSHRTINGMFPPTDFGSASDRTTADQIKLLANGQWTIYWLFNGIAIGTSPHWVKAGDNTYADQGATVIPPGQGMFFDNHTQAASVLSYGEVRANDFIRPLAQGTSLLAGGYPLDQSAAGTGSRQMTPVAGFFGSRDLATADSFYVWNGDSGTGATGYASYFLNVSLSNPGKWVKVGDASLLSRNAEILLLGDRSVMTREKNALNTYTIPIPWTP